MERSKIYALIKQYHLEDEVQKRYGNNFTRVSTEKLQQVIWDYDCTLIDPDLKDAKESLEEEINKVKEALVEAKANNGVSDTNNPYEAACLAFLGILEDNDLLDDLLDKL